MKLFKGVDNKVHIIEDDEPSVEGFHIKEITGTEKTKYLRENMINPVYGYAKLGEVAPMLARSVEDMTDEEKKLVLNATSPYGKKKKNVK